MRPGEAARAGDQKPAESAALLGAGGLNLGFGGAGPLQKGLAGEALGSAAGGFWSAVTGAGQTIATLSREASFASTGITAANFADGAGEAKVVIDVGVFAMGLTYCLIP